MMTSNDDNDGGIIIVNLALEAKVSTPVMIWCYNDFLHYVLYDCYDEMIDSVWMIMWGRSRGKASLA